MMRQFIGREGFVQFIDSVVVKRGQEQGLIVMERCDATFLDVIEGNYVLPLRDGQTYEGALIDLAKQIFEAVHTLGSGDDPIAHRDLKPDNLFIKDTKRDQKLLAKIGDFDKSREFPNSEFKTTENHGHLNYMAPELLQCYDGGAKAKFSPPEWRANDMFALGCSFGELFSGKHPFGGRVAITGNISRGIVSFQSILQLPFASRGRLANLICALTQASSFRRPTAIDCLSHTLFQDPANKVTRLSEVNQVLKRIEFGEERNDPDRRELLNLYNQTSALIIGKRGNWLELVHPKFRHLLKKGYDITKASGLCRFLRNCISHLREDQPDLMKEVFGKEIMTQAELFTEFEQHWPFLDAHNSWFMCKIGSPPMPMVFAEAQESLESEMIEEGTKDGSLFDLRTDNLIWISVNDGPVKSHTITTDGAAVGPHVPLAKVKKLVKSFKLSEGTYELLDYRGRALGGKAPILDGDVIHVKLMPMDSGEEEEVFL